MNILCNNFNFNSVLQIVLVHLKLRTLAKVHSVKLTLLIDNGRKGIVKTKGGKAKTVVLKTLCSVL